MASSNGLDLSKRPRPKGVPIVPAEGRVKEMAPWIPTSLGASAIARQLPIASIDQVAQGYSLSDKIITVCGNTIKQVQPG